MNISSSKAKKVARELLKKSKSRTWREIAEQDYRNEIHYATLNKFANSGGQYVPSDVKTQCLLGLYRKPRRMTPRYMSNDDKAQSWTLWMRGLVRSLRTPTPKELARKRS